MKTSLNIKNLTPRCDGKHYQGYYIVQNPEKYIGDVTKVIYRSSWEKKFASYCDLNSCVLKWSSETIVIPYFDPFKNEMKPYNVDFYMKVSEKDSFKEFLVEIKPLRQLQKPDKPKGKRTTKKLNSYIREMKTYIINESKFKYAREYAKNRGCEFIVVTENFIFNEKPKKK